MESTNTGIQTNANVLSGVIDVYATNAYVENLYLGDPPVDLTTTIAGLATDITVLEGQMITANSNISTLQGQMSTANSNISTLQGQMSTANSNISTLQSEMNDAQADIIALYSTTAASTAAIAGLVISQAAQDVTIAAHTVSIAGLNGDVNALETDVAALQVKTTDQSWGSLTGTSFSTKVNVGGGAGVTLNTGSASEFNSGITTDLVRSFNNNDLVLEGRGTGDAIMRTNGTNRVRCYDNGQINVVGTGVTTVEGSGIAINATTAGIQTFATTSSLFQSTTTTTLTSGGETEINCVALDINATGATNLDTTGIAINATSAGIQTFATTSSLFQSTTTTTLTSGGETEINCAALDINATGLINIDTPTDINVTTSAGQMSFTKTGAAGGINFTSDNFVSIQAIDEAFLTGGGACAFVSTGSSFDIQANTTLTMAAITGNIDMRSYNTDVTIRGDEFKITTDSLTSGVIHNSNSSTNWDMELKNALNPYGIRMSNTGTGGLTIVGFDNGLNQIASNGTVADLQITTQRDLYIASNSGLINTTSETDTSITATTGSITLTAGTDTNITATTGTITLSAGTDIQLTAPTGDVLINTTDVAITTTGDININDKNTLYSAPQFTTAATVYPAFPLNSCYMITSTTASSRDYILPTATSANAGAIFRLVNTVPSTTVSYTISIKTTGTQYLTLGNGDATLNLQTYQLQLDETSVEFIYNGSNYWICMSQRPTIPTGTIIAYPIAMNSTTFGLQNRFILCNGASLNATSTPKYFNLWKVIGTTFGGTGVTAFSLPDLQGTVLKGAGTKTVSQASNSFVGGSISVPHTATLSAFQNDATLVLKTAGYWSNSGSGDESTSRTRIAGDGERSNPTNDTSYYVDRYAAEVRVYNMGVNWYIKL